MEWPFQWFGVARSNKIPKDLNKTPPPKSPISSSTKELQFNSPSRGLGAEIARAFAAEGSNIAINYANNASAAQALASELESAHSIKTATLKADAGSTSEVTSLVKSATEALGGLDIVIANAGWTRFSDFADLDALSERLRADGIGRVYVDGGATIRTWLDAGLVDRMAISVVPVLIGEGIPLFGGTRPDIRLELDSVETFPGGMVQRTYVVSSSP